MSLTPVALSAHTKSRSNRGQYLMIDDGPGFSRDLVVLPLGGEPRPFPANRFNERGGVFSPDGGSVAFVSDESGRDDVYVLRFSGTRHLTKFREALDLYPNDGQAPLQAGRPPVRAPCTPR